MLQILRVKNLAVVENVSVEFGPGLTVITGETGAGKSIIIGALALILGERSDKSMIRTNEEQCGVEATFQLEDSSEIDTLLEETGLDPCDNGSLVIRRIISSSGSGKSFVNDSPATAQLLKKIGDLLVDMHGPYDHQSLLSADSQLNILDAFGHLWKQREDYELLFDQFSDLNKTRLALDGDDQETARQIDLLAYQIKEIQEADLENLVEEDLEKEHTLAANAQQILELASSVQNVLTEEENSAFDHMTFARNRLSELSDILDDAGAWQEEAEAITIQIRELANSISNTAENIEYNPDRLQALEDRKALLHKLKRKYGSTIADILSLMEQSKTRLQDLESRDEKIKEVDKQLAIISAKMKTAGNNLNASRTKTAQSLSSAITKELRDLGFPHGSFDIKLTAVEPGPSGMDQIDFGFAPNIGETMRPLRDIASSGEISRVMLATKAVLAAHDKIPILVFDEIDSNVGGEMGNAIGSKLASISGSHQIICITHLPQVAVHGQYHFVVSKTVQDGRTRTNINTVISEERAEEIARMLGGKNLTGITMRHAEEMLSQSAKGR